MRVTRIRGGTVAVDQEVMRVEVVVHGRGGFPREVMRDQDLPGVVRVGRDRGVVRVVVPGPSQDQGLGQEVAVDRWQVVLGRGGVEVDPGGGAGVDQRLVVLPGGVAVDLLRVEGLGGGAGVDPGGVEVDLRPARDPGGVGVDRQTQGGVAADQRQVVDPGGVGQRQRVIRGADGKFYDNGFAYFCETRMRRIILMTI